MQHLAGIARGVVPICRKCGSFSVGNKVDIVGVTGSIPVTPTILSSTYGTFAKFSTGSTNLRRAS